MSTPILRAPRKLIPKEEWPSFDKLREKLLQARCRLMTIHPWYGHVALGMEWIPSEFPWEPNEEAKTMGVRIMSNGRIECVWYPGFVASQSVEQLFGVVQHEIEHVVRCHCIRVGSARDPRAWNIAADMCINGQEARPKFGYTEGSSGQTVLPLDGQCVWVPSDWEVDQTAEVYYDKIYKDVPRCPTCSRPMMRGEQESDSKSKSKKGKGKENKSGENKSGGKGAGQQSQSGQGQQPQSGSGGTGGQHQHGEGKCPCCGQDDIPGLYEYGQHYGQQIDNHGVWSQTEVSQDEARRLVRDIVTQATAKSQGSAPGHLADAIKELNKPVVRWRELLRSYIGTHVGSSRRTYSRRNRRHDAFGIKGISRHAAAKVRVILDTSGSVGTNELQQFFAEIDQISTRAEVMLLQWDYSFQGYSKYRRNGWRTQKIHGRGGTCMSAPIKWLEDNGQLGDCQILLTDGYCDWAEPRKWYPDLGMIHVITTPEGSTKGPGWGHTVRLQVNE